MLPMPQLDKADPLSRIAFFGPMCSGKTWCANYLKSEARYYRVSFAAKLKTVAYDLYGIDSKDGEARTILQDLGTKLREIDPDVWIKYLLTRVKSIESEKTGSRGVVLDDLRYVNEAKWLKKNGFTLIRVDCPFGIRESRIKALYPETIGSAMFHPSEREWEKIKPDYIVESVDYSAADSIENILAGKFQEVSR